MIYLFFKGQIYYPGPGFEDLHGLFLDRDTAMKALEVPLKEWEWNQLVEVNTETMEWRIIVTGNGVDGD